VRLITKGRIEGKNQQGRPWLEYRKQVTKDKRRDSYIQLKRKADDRQTEKDSKQIRELVTTGRDYFIKLNIYQLKCLCSY